MIRIGMIGFGNMARKKHIPWIRETGKFEIIAASDIVADTGMAAELGVPRYYTDHRDLLADPEVDAVLIASPHDLHREHAVAAFEAGKHVIIEKPIARNLEESQAILDAAERAGTIGMTGFCQRYTPNHAYIRQLIDGGEFGQLLSARADHYQNFRRPFGTWWQMPERVGGGAVIGSGVHRLDLLRWYLGEAESVYAAAAYMPERMEAEACVHTAIKFKNGAVANFSINWAVYDRVFNETLTLSGKDGFVMTGIANKLSRISVDGGKLQDFTAPPCATMYRHFADCIEAGNQPLTSLREGHESLRLVRAIYRSIETGLPVDPQTVTF